MVKNKKLSVFTVAATYIGTVVGAGFASGQEVLQFFTYYGLAGLAGLAAATFLLAFFGYLILDLGCRLKAESHLEVIRYAGGRWVGSFIDWVITFFLFGGLVTMGAGAGAIFSEQLGLPFVWGSLVMIAASLLTVLAGFAGVVTSISFVVPLLLAAVLGVAFYTLATGYDALLASLAGFAAPGRGPVPFWPLAAVLYASYNLVLAVAILAPLGARTGPDKVKASAIWGGVGLGIGATAINLSLLTHIGRAVGFEVPMIFVAGTIAPLIETGYITILLAEIYTTAVGSLYGFAARLGGRGLARYRWIAVGASVLAFWLAQVGFSNLVGTLFPAVGFVGLLLLGSLLYAFVRDRIRPTGAPAPLPAPALEVAEEFAGTENEKRE